MPVSTAPQWRDLPSPYDAAAAARGIESWAETLAALEDRALARRLKTLTLTAAARKSGAAKSNARALLDCLFGNSPSLTQLALLAPATVSLLLEYGPEIGRASCRARVCQ